MFISHLPRFHSHFSIFTPPTSLYTHLFFYPKPRLPISATLFSTPKPNPISHFSSTAAIPTLPTPTHLQNPLNLSPPEETQLEIPIEKLFVPPETDISSENSTLGPRILKGSNIVLSTYARDAQISQAEFVKSSVKTEDCPSDGLPEFALVGRSNVGKSSLLNSLVRRKRLALTSKKPGKTQCINHFRINDSWYLVDLPGYGFAAAPHELRTDWDKFTKDYFLNRSTLVSVFLLIDASIPVKKIDLEYASWLGQNQVIQENRLPSDANCGQGVPFWIYLLYRNFIDYVVLAFD
ncbi:hypothetical protein U1Q18_021772 [Sarracenia purpurea var. burkii]